MRCARPRRGTGSRRRVGRPCGSLFASAHPVPPDKDKKGREVPAHHTWVKDALGLLARIGGGATCLWGEGSWKNKPEDEPIIERTAVVYTYVDPKPFLAELPKLRKFLHRFGRETKQGEVVVEFDSLFYRIRKYDKE